MLPRSSRESHAVNRRLRVCVPSVPPLEALVPALQEIWTTGQLTNGPTVRRLETAVASRLPERHVVAVSSCTSGLMLTLRALGIRGEVILPSFTFAASAHAVVWAGATPVFADCDPETYNVDIVDVARRITPRTQAILGVYVAGNPPRLGDLERLARHAGVKLVLDAAHGMGAQAGGQPAGCFGDAEIFSLTPTKTMTACEGGLVSVRDPDLAERLRIGRDYGNPGDYDMRFVGLNARMSELHAAVGLLSLEELDANVAVRNTLARIYRDRLGALPGVRFQHVAPEDLCSYKDLGVRIVEHQFGVDRDRVRALLEAEGIETRTYFAPPVHRQQAYRDLLPAIPSLPSTESLASEILDLPLYPQLEATDLERVCVALEKAHG